MLAAPMEVPTMKNERPVENPSLQRALDEFHRTLARYGFAGAAMIVSEDEAVFAYKLDAPWSAWRQEPGLPLGVRFRAKSAEDGKQITEQRVAGGVHTICQLADFGQQTQDWMEQLKAMLRHAGIDFQHRPFNGQALPSMVTFDPKEPRE
jgi:hypothetical protein